ncbi:hypothetical protein BIW11_00524 [Tropilaelaps mercedesae]|uniref:C2H2-type domain-containing protein n=1 Tax=Tropilaelaps mercedesae TaxID=418985 RepID=A0A1V9XTZ9_9ACAR|nr:hypothetical protein BIW11_00524 [Tropilaelaps mercedesae]
MHCPVVSCSRSLANRAALHQHLFTHIQGNQKRGAAGLTDDKLCPLCRAEQNSHEGLVRHIVDMHDTRLECTEHEFETMSDFQQWKRRTEQEDLSSFELGRWGKSHFCCCRAGRVEPGKHVNVRRTRLGFECPAAMVVRTDKAQGQPSRVRVTYWRTHLGHTPSVLDVRILKEQREWIVQLLESGHTNRSIVAQGASRYFGPPLNKIHMLTERYLRRLASELQARTDKTIGPGTIDVPKSYEYGNADQLRLALADMIHEGLNREADESARIETEKDYGIHRHDEKILGGYGVLEHGRTGRYQVVKHRYEHIKGDRQHQSMTVVVFPRKAAHMNCEKTCPICQVCVHRYGCTCSAFMLHDRMCVHIHRIASLKGNPSVEYVRPDIVKEDTIGLPEALRRLQTLNHREKMKPLLPLADELFELIKVNRTVHPEQVEAFLRQGLAMMRAHPQLQSTRDEEAQLGPQPIDSAEARRYMRCKHPDNRSYNVISSNWDRNVGAHLCLIVGVEPGTAKIKDEPLDDDVKPPAMQSPSNKEPPRQPTTVKSVVVKMSGPLSKTSQQARMNHPTVLRKRFQGPGNEAEAGPSKKTKFTSVPGSVSGLAGRQAMARRGKDKVVLMKSKRIVVVKPDSLGVRPSGPYSSGPTLSYSYATSTTGSLTHTRQPKASGKQSGAAKKSQWATPQPSTNHEQPQPDFVVIRPNDLGLPSSTGPSGQAAAAPSIVRTTDGMGEPSFAGAYERPNPMHGSVPPGVEPLRPKQEPVDEAIGDGDANPKDSTFTLTQL